MRNFNIGYAACLALLAVPCRAEHAKWGVENWSCGITEAPGRLGDGSDIWLKSIDGSAAGGLSGKTYPTGGMYQKLVVIIAGLPAEGAVPMPPPPSTNNEIDGNLYGLILKQNGASAVNIPVHIVYDPPVKIPGGKLRVYFDGGPQKPNVPCLDAELQLTFQWQTTAP